VLAEEPAHDVGDRGFGLRQRATVVAVGGFRGLEPVEVDLAGLDAADQRLRFSASVSRGPFPIRENGRRFERSPGAARQSNCLDDASGRRLNGWSVDDQGQPGLAAVGDEPVGVAYDRPEAAASSTTAAALFTAAAGQLHKPAQLGQDALDLRVGDRGCVVWRGRQRARGADPLVGLQGVRVDAVRHSWAPPPSTSRPSPEPSSAFSRIVSIGSAAL
jgi:hypothetical protein